MTRLSLFTFFLALTCISCKRPKDNGLTNTNNPTKIELGAYPLAIGNMWVYDNGDTLRVVADTVINGTNAVKIVKANSVYKNVVYCANKTDGLYLLASDTYVAFQGLLNSSYGTYDTLRIPSEPVKFTHLPVVLENTWSAHMPNADDVARRWIGYFSVSTPAGTFNCVKLTANAIDEYYSEKGLIMQVQHVWCVTSPCPGIVTRLVYTNF